jgi:hypothetical protein
MKDLGCGESLDISRQGGERGRGEGSRGMWRESDRGRPTHGRSRELGLAFHAKDGRAPPKPGPSACGPTSKANAPARDSANHGSSPVLGTSIVRWARGASSSRRDTVLKRRTSRFWKSGPSRDAFLPVSRALRT